MIKSLILFDIDGTLAESSKKVEDRMLLKLSFMKGDNYDYGLISGGKYEKIVDQVGINFLLPNKGQMFDYIFCENGMIGYHNNKKFFEKILRDIYSIDQMKEIEKYIINTSKSYIVKNSNLKLEKRNSMWYFSPAGVYCNDVDRNNFIKKDKRKNIRLEIINLLKDKLEKDYGLTIKLGGNIGLAIYPIGWDKSYIIKKNIINISKYNKIYFFGDRCTSDGNDYPLYIHPKINGIAVKNPDDTLNKLLKF